MTKKTVPTIRIRKYYQKNYQDQNETLKFFFYHDNPRTATLISTIFGTASLIAGLGTVKADHIEVLGGGELKFGVITAENELISDGEGDRGYAFFADSELYIEADVSPSEGPRIGAKVVLETDADVEEVDADETFIFMSGGFGLIQAGRTKGAEDAMALGADTIAVGTGGIDGDTESLSIVKVTNSEDAAKVSYFTPRLAGLQFGLSFTPETTDDEGNVEEIEEEQDDEEQQDLEDHVGLGLNFLHQFGGVDISLAAVGSFGKGMENGQDDLDAFSLGGTMALGDLEIGASYGQNIDADDVAFTTLGATLGFGDAKAGVGYNYVDEKIDGITHVIALSGDMEIVNGVELQADVSYADPDNQSSNIASVLALELSF